MGKSGKELLSQFLVENFNNIHETFQILDRTADSSLQKGSWNEVIQMGDQISKQATISGMLWTGGTPDGKELKESMVSYFNLLQGFLLLSHGSTVGAGPTLSTSVHASVKQVIDSSFNLLQGSVSLYEGSYEKNHKPSLPKLSGAVWEACSALKKTPSTNIMAIGRAMTQVAVSVKDVLREMKELKPASSVDDDASDENSTKKENELHEDQENSSDNDLGNDLSIEEMEVAKLATGVVSETLVAIKELIRTISGLLKVGNADENGNQVESLEKLLKLCKGIGEQIDELGACLYPPQEFVTMNGALGKISTIVDEIQVEIESFQRNSEAFLQACHGLRSSINVMESGLDTFGVTEVESKMQSFGLSN